MGKNVHTTFSRNAGNWRNVTEGASRAAATFETKAEATQAGRQMAEARHAEHFIHNKDGQFGARNSYGNDPSNRRG